MTEAIVLDPAAVSVGRTELDITSFIKADGVNWGDGEITAFMADQTIGSSPVDYRLPNRQISMGLSLRNVGSVSFDTISTALQAKVSRLQQEGGWLMRQHGTAPLYADVVGSTLHLGGSWTVAYRDADIDSTLALECIPDFYGPEVALDSFTGTDSVAGLLTFGGVGGQVLGNYPGRARIQVTDTSGQAKHGLLWGLRARYYDSANTAQLIYEAEALKPGASATAGTATGASGGSAVTLASLSGTVYGDVVLMTLADNTPLTHVGSYRVWMRCASTGASPSVAQLQWGVGNTTPFTTNAPAQVDNGGATAWVLVDLGVVRLDKMPLFPHTWSGRIQAIGSGANLSIDKVYLQPVAEFSGKLTVPYVGSYPDSVIVANSLTEVRFDGAYRQSGVNWGPVQYVNGDLPRLPTSGAEGRPIELFVKVTRGDLSPNVASMVTAQQDPGLDSFTAQVKYRPSYVYRP